MSRERVIDRKWWYGGKLYCEYGNGEIMPVEMRCSNCGKTVPITEASNYFHYRNKSKGTFKSWCKECCSKHAKEYNKNRCKTIAYQSKKYRDEHKEEIHNYGKLYREQHKQDRAKRVRERKETDSLFKLCCQVRQTVRDSFKRGGYTKSKRCEELTGLPPAELSNYLLLSFKKTYGREWNREERVHIDHITPLSTANTKQDVERLCHYTNLQLLLAKDNLAKGNKLNYSIKGA